MNRKLIHVYRHGKSDNHWADRALVGEHAKTAEWWRRDWMERHTYFLPRYDDAGTMQNQGHALAAAPGIACLLRRTYQSPAEPAADGEFDFITYFEGPDADVPVCQV